MTGAPEAGDVPVGLSDLPALLDVHEHTPREWRHRSVLPDPDGQIGRSPWWWRTRILLWWHDRHPGPPPPSTCRLKTAVSSEVIR